MTQTILMQKEEYEAVSSGDRPFFVNKTGKFDLESGDRVILQETDEHDVNTGRETDATVSYVTSEGMKNGWQAIAVKLRD